MINWACIIYHQFSLKDSWKMIMINNMMTPHTSYTRTSSPPQRSVKWTYSNLQFQIINISDVTFSLVLPNASILIFKNSKSTKFNLYFKSFNIHHTCFRTIWITVTLLLVTASHRVWCQFMIHSVHPRTKQLAVRAQKNRSKSPFSKSINFNQGKM